MKLSNSNTTNIHPNDNIPLILKQSLKDKNNKEIFIGNYKLDKQMIGCGSFAQVYRAQIVGDKKKQNRALKIIDYEQLRVQNLGKKQTYNWIKEHLQIQEQNLKNCDNPCIVKLYETISTQYCKVFVLEYCNGGTLASYLKGKGYLTQQQAVRIITQICFGVYELYKKKIIHRDLKLENIMRTENGICFSKILKDKSKVEQPSMIAGTQYTQAPQVKNNLAYGIKADIYSIGVMFLMMVVSNYPQDKRLASKLKFNLYKNFKGQKLTQPTFNLLSKMLEQDQYKRIGWEQLLKQLHSHPTFKDKNLRQSNFYQDVKYLQLMRDDGNSKVVISQFQSQLKASRIKSISSTKTQQKQHLLDEIIIDIESPKKKIRPSDHIMIPKKLIQSRKKTQINKNPQVKVAHLNEVKVKKDLERSKFTAKTQRSVTETNSTKFIKSYQSIIARPNERKSDSSGLSKSSFVNKTEQLDLSFEQPQSKEYLEKYQVRVVQAKIAEYILKEIVELLQNQQWRIIDTQSLTHLQLMTLLCQRSYLDIWHAYDFFNQRSRQAKRYASLLQQASFKHLNYQIKLQKLQGSLSKIPKNIFKSIFRSSENEVNHAVFKGEQGRHFKKDQQIQTTIKYINKILPDIKQQMVKSRLKAYRQIVQIECKEDNFENMVFVILQRY